MDLINDREPVMIWGTIGALISSILYQFIPDMGDDLISSIVDFIVVIGPILITLWIARGKVTSRHTLKEESEVGDAS